MVREAIVDNLYEAPNLHLVPIPSESGLLCDCWGKCSEQREQIRRDRQ